MHLKQKKKLIFFMSKKTKIVAIQGDKLGTINKDTDTSLLLALEAQRIGYKIYYYETKNLNLINGKVIAHIKEVKFFDNKKKAICILSATSILKTLLPERQINKKIYFSFDRLIEQLNHENWIKLYIFWELSLIKELGFDSNFFKEKNIDNHIEIDNQKLAIPDLIIKKDNNSFTNFEIQKALTFNKFLIMEYFILPNRLRLPFSRTILEKYYN